MCIGKAVLGLASALGLVLAVGCGQSESRGAASPPAERPAQEAAAAPTSPEPELTGDAALIQSAMSAGPAVVVRGATIMAMTEGGTMRQLRSGQNGFTCIPDNLATPGPDPMCADPNALQWIDAWVQRRAPVSGKVGFVYMLAGGSDASNIDPYAMVPAIGESWIETGPHVMILNAPSLMETHPRTMRPDTSEPFVMWSGTPNAHLMIPVR